MDKLQHIDDLLKSSATSFANSLEVDGSDWLAVEKKLRQRKNRIYAVWFFLALMFVAFTFVLLQNITPKDSKIVKNDKTQVLENLHPTAPNRDDIHPLVQDQNTTVNNQNESAQLSYNPTDKSDNVQSLPAADGKISDAIPNKVLTEETGNTNPITANPTKPDEEVLAENTQEKAANTAQNVFDELTMDEIVSDKRQTSNEKTKKKSFGYWEAGISFTPSISGKFISENSQFAGLINRNYYNNVANNENTAFSNSAGANIQYHLPSGWFVASGLFIAQRTESLNYNYTITEFPRVNNNEIIGYNPLSSAAYINVQHTGSNSYHFVEIPINIGYKQSISSNFELRGQLGMSYLNLFDLSGVKADYTTLELNNLSNYAFNQSNLAANAKLGLYLDKNKFSIGLEPIFNYNITSISERDAAINIKPYSYGLNISTNYKFKN